jgi:hypothetical protein
LLLLYKFRIVVLAEPISDFLPNRIVLARAPKRLTCVLLRNDMVLRYYLHRVLLTCTVSEEMGYSIMPCGRMNQKKGTNKVWHGRIGKHAR